MKKKIVHHKDSNLIKKSHDNFFERIHCNNRSLKKSEGMH